MFKPLSKTQLLERIEDKEEQLILLNNEITHLEIELGKDINHEFIVNQHIKQLKTYNELKDLSTDLIQMIADSREVKVGQVFKEIGIERD